MFIRARVRNPSTSGFLHNNPAQACIWLIPTFRYPNTSRSWSLRRFSTREEPSRNGDDPGQSCLIRAGYPGSGAGLSPGLPSPAASDRTVTVRCSSRTGSDDGLPRVVQGSTTRAWYTHLHHPGPVHPLLPTVHRPSPCAGQQYRRAELPRFLLRRRGGS